MEGVNVYNEISFAGQNVTVGRVWYGMRMVDIVWLYGTTVPLAYTVPSGSTMILNKGTAFNVMQWFFDNYETLPTITTTVYFDDDGECESTDSWKVAFSIRYVGGKAFFVGTTNDSEAMNNTVNNMIAHGYNGCDLNNIIATDRDMANMYLFEVQQEYLPDITNLDPNSGGGTMDPITNQIVSIMNYELSNVVDYATMTVDDMPIAEPVLVESSYDSGVIFWGPMPLQGDFAFMEIRSGVLQHKAYIYGLPAFLLKSNSNYTDDEASTGGGYGQYGFYSDSVDFSELPTIGAEDTGFTVMYAPTLTEVRDLANYMWTDSFITNLKKLISTDPIKAIINFGFIPLDLSNIRGAQQSVVIGNLDTGVMMSKLTEQYISVNMGSVVVPPRWNTALDFEPYVLIDCFVPFVGFVQLPTSEVIRPMEEGPATISIQYNINLFTGEFVAEIKCKCKTVNNVLFSHTGTMMYSIPLTGADYSNFYRNVLGAASRVIPAALGGVGMAAGAAVTGALSAAVTPMEVQRSGTISGGSSVMGAFGAYLVIRQAVQHFSYSAYNDQIGYPSYLFRSLGSLSGFTVCESVKMDGFTGTEEEAAELEQLLKGGVYL